MVIDLLLDIRDLAMVSAMASGAMRPSSGGIIVPGADSKFEV